VHVKRLQTAVLVALALCGCARAPAIPDVFSETIGAWRRTAQREIPADQPPDTLPGARAAAIRAANYEGPGKLEVRVYAMSSAAVALDAVQRWKNRPDTVFFNSGPYFVVIEWTAADRRALQAFVGELEKRLARH
jgi:hypothetical protein